jgi:hypothetical protein
MTNWNQITRQALYKEFEACLFDFAYNDVPVKLIRKTIKKFFEQRFYIKVTNRKHQRVESDTIYVGGCYISERDQEGFPAIQLDFLYNKDQELYNLNRTKYRRIALLTVDTFLHEIIHMRQYRSRKFKGIPGYVGTANSMDQLRTQNYLGDRDEIGAYAFNLACELWDKYGSDHNRSISWLDKDLWQKNPKSVYHDYMVCFDGDHDHPVIQRLKSKTIKYLTNYDIDRPFRTAKYLTY